MQVSRNVNETFLLPQSSYVCELLIRRFFIIAPFFSFFATRSPFPMDCACVYARAEVSRSNVLFSSVVNGKYFPKAQFST